MSETKMNILEEAMTITSVDRRKDYGPARAFYERTAPMWSAIIGAPVTPEQVGLCMIAFKVAREATKPKRDNLVDIAGYARTLEMSAEELQEKEIEVRKLTIDEVQDVINAQEGKVPIEDYIHQPEDLTKVED